MQRRTIVAATTAAGLIAARPPAAQAAGAPPASLDALLAPYLSRFALPALGAAVVKDGRIIAAGTVGTRRANAQVPVTLTDRFHIGSCTKAMTALLAGVLVDAGRIGWNTTIGQTFPNLRLGMDDGLAGVTLEQLLSHIGGIPTDSEDLLKVVLDSQRLEGVNLDAMRRWIIGQWRARPLAWPAGTTFAYSNLGYIIAGAMLESAGTATWEELVSTRIFDALGLTTAGIGPQSSRGRVDAPLGHEIRQDGTLKPILAGPNGDAQPVIGPVGGVHLSILDFATWAGWHAGAGRRGPVLVTPDTLRRLHTKVIDIPPDPNAPPGTPAAVGYGFGWVYGTLPYTHGTVMLHTGSNGLNKAKVLVQPDKDFAMVVATNRDDAHSDEALTALQEALYRAHATPG
ncbi:serine hydrolase domain-containing protein [Neoroseomonas lacus]|uniref:Serine hydrolase n=1 Tax=Neoroseomonas lacus TaxID=287609 RepID=A0A917KXD6_9PROT|nr:serine hydrolase domain-containing protein [Neoroseomonas lacus]GGJ34737.1 serine hydrolase [Neoroseomonas lacus]